MSAARRILVVFPVAQIGGAERLLLHLLERLDRRRFAPAAFVVGRGPLQDELAARDVPCWGFAAHRFREILPVALAGWRLAQLIGRHRAEILHVCGVKSLIYAAPAARLTGARILWHLFDPPPDPPSWQDRIAARFPSDQLVHIAEQTREQFAPLLGNRAASVIRPGVDDPPEADLSLLARYELPADQPVALIATRLQRFKGVHDLLDAAPRIWQAAPDCTIVVLGGSLFGLEPEYRQAIQHKARQIDPQGKRLLVTGHVPLAERQAWQARCTLYVHTAHQEPFGLAIAEAMARGKAVVSTETEGGRLLVDPGETGLLVAPGEPAALADAVLRLLQNPDEAEKMGRAGLARVRDQFHVERMVEQIQAVYDLL